MVVLPGMDTEKKSKKSVKKFAISKDILLSLHRQKIVKQKRKLIIMKRFNLDMDNAIPCTELGVGGFRASYGYR